ncbi:MAG: UbiA family prenyltransferase [Actinomycetes bacterium]
MNLESKVVGLIKAMHLGPTLIVATATFLLAQFQFSNLSACEITLAIIAGQCVVGWSNDLIDYPLDRAVNRQSKPLVSGSLNRKSLVVAIPSALAAAILLSYFGPLGFKGMMIHLLGIASATFYNLGMKSTLLSVLPYAISFGLLPWAVFVAAGKSAPTWIYVGFILFACAFHFLNVVKDMDSDRLLNIGGLPQRLGTKGSLVVAGALVLLGCWDILSR